jgi:hypothetical protein
MISTYAQTRLRLTDVFQLLSLIVFQEEDEFLQLEQLKDYPYYSLSADQKEVVSLTTTAIASVTATATSTSSAALAQ